MKNRSPEANIALAIATITPAAGFDDGSEHATLAFGLQNRFPRRGRHHHGRLLREKRTFVLFSLAMNDDTLNPRFVYSSFLRPNAPFTAHVDRAIEAWQGPLDPSITTEIAIEQLAPAGGVRTARVDLWVEHLDESTCVYGFLCSSADGTIAYARGERVIVNSSGTWTPAFRERVSALRKDLHAYA